MKQVNAFAPLAAASSTKCKALAVGCSTEKSSPGPAAPFNGGENNRLGGGMALVLFLTLLLAVARHTLYVAVRRRE